MLIDFIDFIKNLISDEKVYLFKLMKIFRVNFNESSV